MVIKLEKCYFCKFNRCKILNVKTCQGEECRFRKTEKQFAEGYAKAEKLLADKGLKVVVIDGIVTTEEKG